MLKHNGKLIVQALRSGGDESGVKLFSCSQAFAARLHRTRGMFMAVRGERVTAPGAFAPALPLHGRVAGGRGGCGVSAPAICRRFGSSKRGDQRTSRARRNSALAACSSPL
eukprot:1313927-Pleurochrysis_carterae.AAC.3